ncbi:unnamed protein product [Phyllotreta striolata]|uniref:Uncharacterized protein n=1 Tax=Phyllotreta striolata TaxID=444603 RepID=A0A9N9TF63_PHYSR|nr:unnamed protein product [Phyllotreta striolata]
MKSVLRICIVWICIYANISTQADILPSLTGMFPPIFQPDGLVKKIMDTPRDLTNIWSALKMPTLNNQITVSTKPYVNVSRNYYKSNIKNKTELNKRSKRSKTTKTTNELITELLRLSSEESNQSGDCHQTISKIRKLIAQLEPILLLISHLKEDISNINEKTEETTQNMNVEDQTKAFPREQTTQAPRNLEAHIRNILMQNSAETPITEGKGKSKHIKKHSEETTTERSTSTKRSPKLAETSQPAVIDSSTKVSHTVHKETPTTRRHKFHKKSKAIKENDDEFQEESELTVTKNPQKRHAKKKKTRHVRETKYSTTPTPIEEATEDNPRKSDEPTTIEATLLTTPAKETNHSTDSTPNSEISTQRINVETTSTSTPTKDSLAETTTISSLTEPSTTKKSNEEINDTTVTTISPTSTNIPIKEATTAKIETSIQPTSTDSPVENSTPASVLKNTVDSTIKSSTVTEQNKIETTTKRPEDVTTVKTTNLQEDKKVNLPKLTQQDNSASVTEGPGITSLVKNALQSKTHSRRKRSENVDKTPSIKDKSKLKIDLNELPEFVRTLSIQQAINQEFDGNHKPAPIPLTIKLDNAISKPVRNQKKENISLKNRLRLIEENYQKIHKKNRKLLERQKLLEHRFRREGN